MDDLREQLKESADVRRAAVIVREWPGEPTVYVHELSIPDLVGLGKETRKRMKRDKSRVRHIERMVIATVHKEDGTPLFKPEDEEWLGTKGSSGLMRLFNIASKMNGQDTDDDELDLGNS